MSHHRGQGALNPRPFVPPSRAALSPGSFLLCPVALQQGLTPAQQWNQWFLYQLAREQAEAQLRPSLPERGLLAVWN